MGYGRHMHHGMRGFGGLRTFVLNILAEKRAKGADIINELNKRTMGWWKPSPGSVYPLLSSMERDGLIRRLEDGSYEITQAGREEIEARTSFLRGFRPFGFGYGLEDIINELKGYVMYFKDDPAKLKEHENDLKEIYKELGELLRLN
ncbi:MAG: PadR family transcriptional regulator [Thermoplasmataceae archaeon]